MTIKIDGAHFKDEQGRILNLRGVNLGGSSKVPFTPNGATHIRQGFFNHRDISFVGRPFPLEEADEHFSRLKTWGLTFLRFIVTWEAIEHGGPGIYDQDYLDYLRAILEKAGEYGMIVFIDPHQDVWSRFSGGDGAPGWTFEKMGLDITAFKETAAAVVHATADPPYPLMIWTTNWIKFATSTMFTLFFAGDDFAPKTTVESMSVQEYLQSHYINAFKQVAQRVHDLPHVVGYDIMNEPAEGFIGWQDIRQQESPILMGYSPTPWQSMLLASGYAQMVDKWSTLLPGVFKEGIERLDPKGKTAWLDGYDCIWKQNGVWEQTNNGTPHLLDPAYFATANGKSINFGRDYMRPFFNRYAAALREIHPEAIMFLENRINTPPPDWGEDDAQNIAYAPHYYDDMTLFAGRYNESLAVNSMTLKPVFGKENARNSIQMQFGLRKQWSKVRLGNVPVIIGETGIPISLGRGKSYRIDDYSQQIKAFDRIISSMEANLLHFTLWNYTADNSNTRGDLWNGEDLSLFSPDQQDNPEDINSGGRALEAVVRPYAQATAGTPLRMHFDIETGVFELTFRHDETVDAPTEIFLPRIQFPHGCEVEVSDGEYEINWDEQLLIYHHSGKDIPHRVKISALQLKSAPKESIKLWQVFMLMLLWIVALRFFTGDKQE